MDDVLDASDSSIGGVVDGAGLRACLARDEPLSSIARAFDAVSVSARSRDEDASSAPAACDVGNHHIARSGQRAASASTIWP